MRADDPGSELGMDSDEREALRHYGRHPDCYPFDPAGTKRLLPLVPRRHQNDEDRSRIVLRCQINEKQEESRKTVSGIFKENEQEEGRTEEMIVKEMIAEKVFAEGVAKDIRNFLPAKYENAEFQVMQMNKNNGVQMVGVQVRLQEENVCPVVYVEPFFNEIRLGEPVEKVMNEIAKCMEEAGNAPFVHNGINPMDYDSVKEHLAVMLVNTQANKRMLQEMPHENIEDLSAICYVDFPVESNDGKATMKVKNEHLKMWNVDAKEMFQQARANTQPVNTPILQSMDEMLLSIFNEEGHATNLLDENVDFGLRSHDMLYALTNVEKQYGASMITQPEVLNKLEQLFPEGFYVLPSSVHEVLIVPDNGEMEPKMLGEMVREVNKNEVERQEVLSDRVYSYDKEKHQIRQEPDSIQKVKEMER